MKKSVLYIIIVVLVIGVVSGVTYLVLDSKKEEDKTVENNPESKSDNQTDEKESTTISESDLEEYLSYIPDTSYYTVYDKKYNDITSVDSKTLLYMVLVQVMNNCDVNYVCALDFDNMDTDKNNYYSKTDDLFYEELEKMYNITDYKLEDSKEEYIANGNVCYTYNEGYFVLYSCSGSYNTVHNVLKYEFDKEDNLVIYSNSVGLVVEDENNLVDYYNKYSIDLEFCNNNGCAKEILKENTDNFSKYKHIFKKSSTGYYWYSTEVVE